MNLRALPRRPGLWSEMFVDKRDLTRRLRLARTMEPTP